MIALFLDSLGRSATRLVLTLLFTALTLGVLALALLGVRAIESAPPPDPRQPQTDLFLYNGASLQPLNPVSAKALRDYAVTYRLLTMPGCSTGTVPSDLAVVERELMDKVGFSLSRNDAAYDFTIRINCGTEHIRICGSVNIFCLGRGFPYNADVEISDIISTYYPESRYSIICHEVCGHAIGTWNEQYCPGGQTSGVCVGLARFASTPGWIDFMNTGPNSRHLFGDIELGRWYRTIRDRLAPCTGDPCWNGARWQFSSGWTVDPATDQWYDPTGRLFWLAADFYRWRFSPVMGVALPGGTPYWTPDFQHLFVP